MSTPDVLIIDATCEGDPARSFDFKGRLQEVIATYLALPLVEVEQAWSAVKLCETRQDYTPGRIYATSLTTIERELARLAAALALQGKTLHGLQTIIVVDDAAQGRDSVVAGLAVQIYKRTRVAPVVIGVQEMGRSAWRVVDAIPERGEMGWNTPQTVGLRWMSNIAGNIPDHLALSIVAQVRQVISVSQRSPVSPDFDAACAELERLCGDAQELLAYLLATAQLLPIHAVVSRLVPQLPAGMDELALWDLEGVARKAFARACYLDLATEEAARKVAQEACIGWALRRLGGKDLLDLPNDLVRLIECVLDQVGHRAFRRKETRRQEGNATHASA